MTSTKKIKIVNLGDVVNFEGGGTPSKANSEYWGGDIPWASVKDVSGPELSSTVDYITEEGLANSASRMVPAGNVILPTRMALGRAAINTIDVAINQDLRVAYPNQSLDRRYLLWFIISNARLIESLGSGATVKGITLDKLRDLQIPLPLLAEQKRIAAILDKADVIRRKLQQSLRLSDDFLRSVFLDMFGDPVTHPKGWPVVPLSEGVEFFDGGKNVNPIDTDRRDGMRVLKVSAVTSGEYREAESKSFGEDFNIPADYIVKSGDLLISRANTAELVGAVAYVWNTTGRAMLPDKLWRFVWSKPAKINPLFMLHLGRSEHFRKQLILRATGSSGSMKNIGKVKMLEIPIPLPPIALQNKFAAIVNKTQGKIQKSTAFLQDAESLFSSLQQRAFRGEL
ncbi:MAG: restriction endonuclease subunit S [Verrucomicrobiota bacterium]